MAKQQTGRARTPQARQRAAELRRQQETRERRRTLISRAILIGSLVAIGGGVIGYAAYDQATKGKFKEMAGVQVYDVPSRQHVDGTVKYPQTPPVGGDHNATPLNCGIYDQPVPNENAVHDLEHGAVWITYQEDLPKDDVTQLQQIVEENTRGFLDLSPYKDLPSPVVASAWGRQLTFNGVDEGKLTEFIDKYQLGPQAPELGSACKGTGTPITPGG